MTNKISFAGFEITATKRGSPMRPALVKMLRNPMAQGRVRAILTSQFDGMIDGARDENAAVSLDTVANFIANAGQTFGAYVGSRGDIHVFDACRSFKIVDAVEDERRAAMIASLPALVGEDVTNGYLVRNSGEMATRDRAINLDNKTGIDFDEAIETLRPMSDPLQVLSVMSGGRVNWQPVRALSLAKTA